MKPHSDTTKQFRALTREEKFKSVLAMCNTLGTIPKTYSTKNHTPSESERVHGQFYINMQSALNRGKLPKMYINYIKAISEYGNRVDVGEKIDLVHAFFCDNKRLPTHKNDDVTLMNQWKSIKSIDTQTDNTQLTKCRRKKLTELISFSIQSMPKSKHAKLTDLLNFCIENNRTPRQHSLNPDEKKLADFLSTIKQGIKTKPLPPELNALYQRITTFAPPPRVPSR